MLTYEEWTANGSPPLIGSQLPRLFYIPPGDFSSAGEECIQIAQTCGLYLDPWQKWVINNSLIETAEGKWAAFEVGLTVGRQNGKGSILEAREIAGLFAFGEQLILHTAHQFKTSSEAFRRVRFLVENTPEFAKRILKFDASHGEEGIELKPKPTIIIGADGKKFRRGMPQRIRFIARSKVSGRGFTGDLLVYDEDMILDATDVGASLPTLSARPNPQVWYTGSAGTKLSTQKAKVRRRAIDGGQRSLVYMEWSANAHDEYCEPECTKHAERDDLHAWSDANPAMGYRLSIEHTANEFDSMDNEEFDRERLGIGQYPVPADGWLVIPQKWYQRAKDSNPEPPELSSVVCGIFVPPNRGYANIVVAGHRPDGKIGVVVAERRRGTAWLKDACLGIQKERRPNRWIIDPRGAAGAFIEELEEEGLRIEKVTATEVAHACGDLYSGFKYDDVKHLDQDPLRKAIAAIDSRPLSESWSFDWKNCVVDASPLMAASLAFWGYKHFGAVNVSNTVHMDVTEIVRLCNAGVYGDADLDRLREIGILDDNELVEVREIMRGRF